MNTIDLLPTYIIADGALDNNTPKLILIMVRQTDRPTYSWVHKEPRRHTYQVPRVWFCEMLTN